MSEPAEQQPNYPRVMDNLNQIYGLVKQFSLLEGGAFDDVVAYLEVIQKSILKFTLIGSQSTGKTSVVNAILGCNLMKPKAGLGSKTITEYFGDPEVEGGSFVLKDIATRTIQHAFVGDPANDADVSTFIEKCDEIVSAIGKACEGYYPEHYFRKEFPCDFSIQFTDTPGIVNSLLGGQILKTFIEKELAENQQCVALYVVRGDLDCDSDISWPLLQSKLSNLKECIFVLTHLDRLVDDPSSCGYVAKWSQKIATIPNAKMACVIPLQPESEVDIISQILRSSLGSSQNIIVGIEQLRSHCTQQGVQNLEKHITVIKDAVDKIHHHLNSHIVTRHGGRHFDERDCHYRFSERHRQLLDTMNEHFHGHRRELVTIYGQKLEETYDKHTIKEIESRIENEKAFGFEGTLQGSEKIGRDIISQSCENLKKVMKTYFASLHQKMHNEMASMYDVSNVGIPQSKLVVKLLWERGQVRIKELIDNEIELQTQYIESIKKDSYVIDSRSEQISLKALAVAVVKDAYQRYGLGQRLSMDSWLRSSAGHYVPDQSLVLRCKADDVLRKCETIWCEKIGNVHSTLFGESSAKIITNITEFMKEQVGKMDTKLYQEDEQTIKEKQMMDSLESYIVKFNSELYV